MYQLSLTWGVVRKRHNNTGLIFYRKP